MNFAILSKFLILWCDYVPLTERSLTDASVWRKLVTCVFKCPNTNPITLYSFHEATKFFYCTPMSRLNVNIAAFLAPPKSDMSHAMAGPNVRIPGGTCLEIFAHELNTEPSASR